MSGLSSLKIKNFALLENAVLKTAAGLNVITGRTGAGKSILVGALSMVLGERIGKEIVRKNTDFCEVEAVFSIGQKGGSPMAVGEIRKFLKEKELNDKNELLLRRKFYSQGHSRCFINDHSVTLSTLKSLGEMLVDIHSQNQHQSLLKNSRQSELLDAYAKSAEMLGEIKKNWIEYISLNQEKEKKIKSQNQIEEEIDKIKLEIEEIESVNLKEGLDDELENDYNKLNNYNRIHSTLNEIHGKLYESDGSVIENISTSLAEIEDIISLAPDIKPAKKSIEKANFELESACQKISSYLGAGEFDVDRLEEVLDLREKINSLKRKHNSDIGEILKYCQQQKKNIEQFEDFNNIIKKLDEDIKKSFTQLNELSKKLSKLRITASKKLSDFVNKNLKTLGMAGAKFDVKFTANEVGPNGKEKIGFYIRTNIGSDSMELAKVASGGEVSRIMLAIKTVLANADNIPVLIFDEIDAGIGATEAVSVGKKLKELSKYHQIISITHLPQIAENADVHIKVDKEVSDGVTRTLIKNLNKTNREKELSRMFGRRKR